MDEEVGEEEEEEDDSESSFLVALAVHSPRLRNVNSLEVGRVPKQHPFVFGNLPFMDEIWFLFTTPIEDV